MPLQSLLMKMFSEPQYSRPLVEDLRAKIGGQQALIRTRRAEKQRLEEEAGKLRAEADRAALRGMSGMQLGVNNYRPQIEEGELWML